ncbi:MAG: hypothetical protein LBU83_12230, partial [Bacteroidales bacterium]|nr:hypothetical protein [Bacteroidales bacterium]
DWNDLVEAAGGNVAGTRLKSRSPDWDGTDDFGFSALPGGSRTLSGNFFDVGSNGFWWSATEIGSGIAWYRGMGSGYGNVFENFIVKGTGLSVLCLQD